MQRSSISSLLCLPLAAALFACSKEEAKPAHEDSPKSTPVETAVAPAAGASEVTASPTPAKPDAPADPAAAPTPTPKEPEAAKEGAVATGEAGAAKPEDGVVATGEAAAVKPDEKAAASTEESADAKKNGKKKKTDEKAAEAPAKETKPKFTELGIQVTKTGTGVAATAGKHVTIHYKASVADAEKPFDSTFASNRPLEIELGAGAKLPVIEGLRRGLEGLMPGSEVRLQIPANLAWGEKGNPAVGVPANADVVFEVQVLDVQ